MGVTPVPFYRLDKLDAHKAKVAEQRKLLKSARLAYLQHNHEQGNKQVCFQAEGFGVVSTV